MQDAEDGEQGDPGSAGTNAATPICPIAKNNHQVKLALAGWAALGRNGALIKVQEICRSHDTLLSSFLSSRNDPVDVDAVT